MRWTSDVRKRKAIRKTRTILAETTGKMEL